MADIGYPPPDLDLLAAGAAAAGAEVAPLLRIEQRAGVIAAGCERFDEFLDRFDAELAAPAPPATAA